MSGRGRNAAPVVVREYRHSRNECVRALELLLKEPVSKAARPAPEPDGYDGTETKEDSANDRIISRK
jgi:hypothetical protein